LCKVLCHNLCCLIQSTYELGVEATFWVKEETPAIPSDRTEPDPIDILAWV
jgi:hypothetical protein